MEQNEELAQINQLYKIIKDKYSKYKINSTYEKIKVKLFESGCQQDIVDTFINFDTNYIDEEVEIYNLCAHFCIFDSTVNITHFINNVNKIKSDICVIINKNTDTNAQCVFEAPRDELFVEDRRMCPVEMKNIKMLKFNDIYKKQLEKYTNHKIFDILLVIIDCIISSKYSIIKNSIKQKYKQYENYINTINTCVTLFELEEYFYTIKSKLIELKTSNEFKNIQKILKENNYNKYVIDNFSGLKLNNVEISDVGSFVIVRFNLFNSQIEVFYNVTSARQLLSDITIEITKNEETMYLELSTIQELFKIHQTYTDMILYNIFDEPIVKGYTCEQILKILQTIVGEIMRIVY